MMLATISRALAAAVLLGTVGFPITTSAQWLNWTDETNNHRWSDDRNWNLSRRPLATDDGVALAALPGPTISGTAAAVQGFVNVGAGGDARLTITNKGSLTVKIAVTLGCSDGATGTLVMEPGSQLKADQIYIGNGGADFGARGVLMLNGGTIDCTHFSVLRARALRSEARVSLMDGTVRCWDFFLNRDSIRPPRVDIWRGKIVQRRNDVKRIQDWVHSKWIVGYGGKGRVIVEFDTPAHPACTVIRAIRD